MNIWRCKWYPKMRRRHFLLSCLEIRPLLWSQNSSEMCFICICKAVYKVQFLKHLWEEVITKNLPNKKKFEKSPRKEEGGDAKLVYFLLGLTHSNWWVTIIPILINRFLSMFSDSPGVFWENITFQMYIDFTLGWSVHFFLGGR